MGRNVETMNPATDPHAIIVTPRRQTMEIIRAVAKRHGVTAKEILGTDRNHKVMAARNEAIREIFAARPHWSYPDIGRLFRRDHTTIMHHLWTAGAHVPRKRPAPRPLATIGAAAE
jgi:hypothetical protein